MTRIGNHRLILPAGLALAALLTTAGPSHASNELRSGIAEIAKSIKQLLDGKGEDSIVVGAFTGPANYPTSAGPGIQQVLAEELSKISITVKKRAKLGIKGEYLVTEVPADEPRDVAESRRPKVLAILLKGTVEDEFGKIVTDFSFKQTVIRGDAAFVNLIGAPVDLPPNGTDEQRDKKIRESLSKPKTFITKTRISASPDGKLAIEVLVNGEARAVKDDEGLAYLAENINRGQVYAVRLINDTDQEMAVQLTIDGLSMFQFSELRVKDGPKKGQPAYGTLILGPKKHFDVKGWHCTNERSTEFKVTEYAETAAASINQTANLGTITVSFRASWPKGSPPPGDEPSKTKSTTSGDGTGFGKSFEQKFKEVERTVGVIRSSVSVRYAR